MTAIGGVAAIGAHFATPKKAKAASGNDGFDPDLVLLIDRITGGFSLAEYQHAESLGYEGYLAEQLAYESLIDGNDPALEARLAPYDIKDMSGQMIRDTYLPMNQSFIPYRQTTSIQLVSAVYAKAQLYHRMFQFWNHHLNIDLNSSGAHRFILWPFLRDAVLANSMTTVPDLISASVHGGAMMLYLNNNANIVGAPNENYARELMELHTLGVDNGYTQTDIEELARILTGWSVCLNGNGCGALGYGDFLYRANVHDAKDKVFLGNDITGQSGANGQLEGEEAIAILVGHENAADFFARKLCRFFLGGLTYNYDPPEDIVQMVKWTYLNSNPLGDIRSMLNIILHRDVLTSHAVPKFRRPYDLATAALRALGADLVSTNPAFLPGMRFSLTSMGMNPNFWGPPNGPFDSKSWSEGSIIPRWSFFDALATNGLVSDITPLSVGTLLSQVDATAPGTQAQGLNILLTGGRMHQREVNAVQDFIGFKAVTEAVLQESLGLAMSLPTYQFI
jgi:uncharacterized protein (DUF1800 family)